LRDYVVLEKSNIYRVSAKYKKGLDLLVEGLIHQFQSMTALPLQMSQNDTNNNNNNNNSNDSRNNNNNNNNSKAGEMTKEDEDHVVVVGRGRNKRKGRMPTEHHHQQQQQQQQLDSTHNNGNDDASIHASSSSSSTTPPVSEDIKKWWRSSGSGVVLDAMMLKGQGASLHVLMKNVCMGGGIAHTTFRTVDMNMFIYTERVKLFLVIILFISCIDIYIYI
jgi:hypothetical protein